MIITTTNTPQEPANNDENQSTFNAENKDASTGEDLNQFYKEQVLSAEEKGNEITNNDGSVIETLDATFHDTPGFIGDHSIAGSNRADFYEKRSQGKSDTAEEQDYVRDHQPE
jgi:hypothetical protein